MRFIPETEKVTIQEEEWISRFRPLPAPIPGKGFDFGEGCTLIDGQTKEDIKHLEEAGERRVWTIVEDGESMAIIPGMALVNRLGYVVTENPWTDDITEVILED